MSSPSLVAVTITDLLVVGIVLFGAVSFRMITRHIERGRLAVGGQWAVVVGLGILALFYLTDLFTNWVMPHYLGSDAAAAIKAARHLEVEGVVSLLAIGLISVGLILDARGLARVVRRLQASEEKLETELARANALAAANANMQQTTDESQARYRRVFDFVPEAMYLHDGVHIFEANPAAVTLYGYDSVEDMRGLEVLSLLHPDDHARFLERLADMRAEPRTLPYVTDRRIRADGSIIVVEQSGTPIEFGGKVLLLAVNRDVTDVQASAERLRQSQKMEAVGQLTGGIAHDFNNVLAIVLGNLGLAQSNLSADASVQRYLGAAETAVERGAELTSRLLSFARKQPLAPESLDLNAVVSENADLLQRALGERIEVQTIRGAGLWPIMCDRVQLETALLNLVLNARDAMQGVGKLTIELSNADISREYAAQTPDLNSGAYVVLAVSDTGCGMSPEVKAHVFEPFFTTKEPGKGTGLGLSMVFGFTKQTGGHLTVYSELDVGTTFRMYLPRGESPVKSSDTTSEAAAPGAAGLKVLVVEDESALRLAIYMMLEQLGAQVFEAGDGSQALGVLESEGPFDLLLTDVVLSGDLSGHQLALKVRERSRYTRVLYMSGYTENAILHDGRLDPGVHLISKPFTSQQLDGMIQKVMG